MLVLFAVACHQRAAARCLLPAARLRARMPRLERTSRHIAYLDIWKRSASMVDHHVPTREEVIGYLHERRNWGRWGDDDQMGLINLITPEKRIEAASLVRSGRNISLSRDFPKLAGSDNPYPAHHWMKTVPRGTGGFS